MLEARRIDGGEQFFTRANDFGYSKSADETLNTWDKSKILGDVVWVIRKFRPDIVITRFPPDERAGHGHHTSSAMLAEAAFKIAGDPKVYPEQLKYVDVWQPKRVFINTGRWWNNTISEDTPGVVAINVGKYNSLLGESYTEIAAKSRSAHKSQGFGATGSRGEYLEYLELLTGEPAQKEALEGIDITWNRVDGGKEIDELIDQILVDFNFQDPSASIDQLLDLRLKVLKIKDEFWRSNKINSIDNLVLQCAGIYAEMTAETFYGTSESNLKTKLEIINRSDALVNLKKVVLKGGSFNEPIEPEELAKNKKAEIEREFKIDGNASCSQPYWLIEKGTLGTYSVNNQQMIGLPEGRSCITADITLSVFDTDISLEVPLVHKWNDPVKGEQYEPFVILPEVTVNIDKPVYIFSDDESQQIDVKVKSFSDKSEGVLKPILPKDWSSDPQKIDISLSKEAEQNFTFKITPPKDQQVETISFMIVRGDATYDKSFVKIEYDHIRNQTYLPKAEAKLVRVSVNSDASIVGYIQGAGDEVPEALRNIGVEVEELLETDLESDNLSKYDAIMLGVRALNTNERIDFYMKKLFDYVQNGGNLIIQYNTNFRLKTDNYAPFKLELSRDRVSEEDAEVRILLPEHAALNYPNKIDSDDFTDWVQERGLYFPNKWSEEYSALLSMNDKGETAKDGSLLVARYGKGNYVYTGLSFFRELPAGVPGAYRLLANLISLGSNSPSSN